MKLSWFVILVTLGLTFFSGCKSIEVDRRGETLAFDPNGEVVKDAAGNPIKLDKGWSVDYFQHWNWQKFDSLDASAGPATLKINNYQSGADSNLNHLVTGSIESTTKLVTAIGEAYVKIAGGGAQAETAATIAQKAYQFFTSSGGDPDKAVVKSSTDFLVISDGTTSTMCDSDGNCTKCSTDSK